MRDIDEKMLRAAANGDAMGMRKCIFQGANPKGRDRAGRTALILALQGKSCSVPELLSLVQMCDVAAKDDKGDTALMWAARLGQEEVGKALLPGGDPHAAEAKGQTALMLAAQAGAARLVEILLPASNPSAVDESGRTALMIAAQHGRSACADLLLPVSDAAAVDGRGLTALLCALEAPAMSRTPFPAQCAVARTLLAVSDPLATTELGSTALILAATAGSEELVARLLPLSDVEARGPQGSAIDCARLGGHAGVADMIGAYMERVELARSLPKAMEPAATSRVRI